MQSAEIPLLLHKPPIADLVLAAGHAGNRLGIREMLFGQDAHGKRVCVVLLQNGYRPLRTITPWSRCSSTKWTVQPASLTP